jgi:NADPH2:quinone reductase
VKAVLVRRAGGPDVLELVEQPVPNPGHGEVRVRLHSIGVNYADVMCRKAIHRSMRPPPIVLGCEASGIIEACGTGTPERSVGERVGVYSPFGGAYAEALVVPESYALRLPDSMTFEEGAAFTHVYLTAYQALHGISPLQKGSSVLVTAAAGGLGGAVIQLASAAGARVIAAVGSASKRAELQARGIEHVIDYGSSDLTAETLRATSQRGVDLAIETVGGRIFQQAQQALAPLGRIVIAGMAGGGESQPDIPALLARSASCATLNLSVVYSQQPAHMRGVWAQLCSLYATGGLSPDIGNRFPLAQAADAHRLLESRANVGKILLNPRT